MQFEKVDTKRRSQVVAEKLLEMIKTGKISDGQKLPPEREIADAMGVSRNTLREAIAALEIIGIVEIKRSQGIYIVPQRLEPNGSNYLNEIFSKETDVFQVIDARLAFEPGVGVLAVEVATNDNINSLELLMKQLKISFLEGQYQNYHLLDCKFHQEIANVTQNDLIIDTIRGLLEPMSKPLWRAMKKNLPATGETSYQNMEHEAICNAIVSRDKEQTWKSMRLHLENSKKRFLY